MVPGVAYLPFDCKCLRWAALRGSVAVALRYVSEQLPAVRAGRVLPGETSAEASRHHTGTRKRPAPLIAAKVDKACGVLGAVRWSPPSPAPPTTTATITNPYPRLST